MEQLRDVYDYDLCERVIPFWLKHGVDRECAFYLFYIYGSVLSIP